MNPSGSWWSTPIHVLDVATYSRGHAAESCAPQTGGQRKQGSSGHRAKEQAQADEKEAPPLTTPA